jgi:membrane protein DedA with SNARE-associated domain/rhodanese-related sulfurtransferase
MVALLELILAHGPLVVFANVLVEQLGAPLPAVPMLMVAGALAEAGRVSAPAIVLAALAGSSLANLIWFAAGRRHGRRVLALMCRVSLSPDSCVRQTENVYARWGVASLLVARFIPGLSSVAAPLAGAMGLSLGAFVLFDALGTVLWASLAVFAGYLFHAQIDQVLAALEGLGGGALAFLAAALVLYLGLRAFQRWRLIRFLRARRISVDELRSLLEDGGSAVVLDARSRAAREADPRRIPGDVAVDLADLEASLADVPREAEVIVYCSCPNEASAARVAKSLMARGFRRVRPLAGGLEAWAAMPARSASA